MNGGEKRERASSSFEPVCCVFVCFSLIVLVHPSSDLFFFSFSFALLSRRFICDAAEVVSWGPDRPAALDQLTTALQQYQIVGVPSNIDVLQKTVQHSKFRAGPVTTNFLAAHVAELGSAAMTVRPPPAASAAATAYVFCVCLCVCVTLAVQYVLF